jgi:hypothetical protein
MSNTVLHKQGIVEAFNISPHGAYEGLLLRMKNEIMQINFPQQFGATIAGLTREGEELDAKVLPEKVKGSPSHPVYRLVSFTSGKERKKFSFADAGSNRMQTFSGRVQRLNYALHGEVNGATLDSGDLLHVKPHGARALQLDVGMDVNGVGSTKLATCGHRVIEAQEVNGIEIERKPEPKKKTNPKRG